MSEIFAAQRELLTDAESRELVGAEVKISTDDGKNTATW